MNKHNFLFRSLILLAVFFSFPFVDLKHFQVFSTCDDIEWKNLQFVDCSYLLHIDIKVMIEVILLVFVFCFFPWFLSLSLFSFFGQLVKSQFPNQGLNPAHSSESANH